MMSFPAALLRASLSVLAASGISGAEIEPSSPVSLTIGGRTILVPPPAGHVRCDGVNPDWDRAVGSMQPAGNRMLANFGSPQDHAAIRDGETASFERSLNIQIRRSLENTDVDERMFADMRKETRNSLKSLRESIEALVNKSIEAGSRQMSDDLGVDVQLSVGDMAMLGIFEDSATSLGFTMAMTTAIQGPAGEEKSRDVVAAVLVPVNGRLLYLYSNAGYQSEADRLAVERSVRVWRDAIVAANPEFTGSRAGSLTQGVGKSAMVGAIAGGIVALLAVVYRRFKR
jgi:hypothetical protein